VSSLLVTGIGELVTNDPQAGPGPLGILRDAALVAEDGQVAWVGPAGVRVQYYRHPDVIAAWRARPGSVSSFQ